MFLSRIYHFGLVLTYGLVKLIAEISIRDEVTLLAHFALIQYAMVDLKGSQFDAVFVPCVCVCVLREYYLTNIIGTEMF